jgi:hypothetical protein
MYERVCKDTYITGLVSRCPEIPSRTFDCQPFETMQSDIVFFLRERFIEINTDCKPASRHL